ncbi:MAG: hypothetical protein R3336_04750, partial [Phycisphaeraceae bacterium]|nr:hypothetical protein [Phycisphaeraceae bacterium]
MECQNCGYQLWMTRDRNCPECGRAFAPSEFEFPAGKVAFCCPHCDQAYYGTDARGHLQPKSFDCTGCGEAVHMDEMILRPEGAEASLSGTNPWLNLERHGRIAGWFKTVGHVMSAPGRLMDRTPASSSVYHSLRFFIVNQALMTMLGVGIWLIGLTLIFALFAPGGGAGSEAMMFAAFVLAGCLAVIVGGVIVLLVWAISIHIILCLGGDPDYGLGRTIDAVAYASGTLAIAAVPLFGYCLVSPAWLWWLIASGFTVCRGQRVSGLRAGVAVAFLPVITVVLFISVSLAGLGYSTGPGGSLGLPAPSIQSPTDMADAWLMSDVLDGQTRADHVLGWVDAGHLRGYQLVYSGQVQVPMDRVPVIPGVSLSNYFSASPSQQQVWRAQAEQRLPPGNQPYRFGQVVFTHRGLAAMPSTGDRIAAIFVPGPPSPRAGHGARLAVISFGGIKFEGDQMWLDNLIRQENQLRTQHGLPPIPDVA